MLRGGATWKVKLLKDGTIHLERDETGEVDQLALAQWQQECSEGVTRMVGAPGADLTPKEQALRKVAFRDLPGNVRASGLQKFFYAQAFDDPMTFYDDHLPDMPRADRLFPNKAKRQLEPFAAMVATAFQARHGTELVQLFERPGATARQRPRKARDHEPVPAHFLRVPSKSTYCGWLAQWEDIAARNGQPDIRLMASRYHDRGPTKRTMSARVEEWLNAGIDLVWLTPAQRKKTAVYDHLRNMVGRHNQANPDNHLAMPSRGHVNRYIREEVDQETATRRRRGDKIADGLFKPVGEGPQPTYVLETVEVDHTRADVDVLDDVTGMKLGRPWVTTALDRYSRLPVGVHVHFDGPSLGAVMLALRDTMMPKDYLRELLPDLDYDYPGCGRPVAYFFDRGSDFDNDHVRDVSLEFDIRCDYEPGEQPQYKGRLERWHRTMEEEVAHPLPGATPPHDGDGYRRDPEGNAYITFGDYRRRLMHWITMVYARTPHRTIRTTPLLKWEEGNAKRLPRPLPPRDSLNVLLNRLEYLSPSNRGVQWSNLRWNGDVLRRIRADPAFRKGQRVMVRIDDSDVSRAWVTDPVTRMQEPLQPVFADYMPGLTLYQHRMAMLWSDEQMEGARDEPSLIAARQTLDAQAEALLQGGGKRKKANAAVARHRGAKAVQGQMADAPPERIVPLDFTDDGEDIAEMREVRKNVRPKLKGERT